MRLRAKPTRLPLGLAAQDAGVAAMTPRRYLPVSLKNCTRGSDPSPTHTVSPSQPRLLITRNSPGPEPMRPMARTRRLPSRTNTCPGRPSVHASRPLAPTATVPIRPEPLSDGATSTEQLSATGWFDVFAPVTARPRQQRASPFAHVWAARMSRLGTNMVHLCLWLGAR